MRYINYALVAVATLSLIGCGGKADEEIAAPAAPVASGVSMSAATEAGAVAPVAGNPGEAVTATPPSAAMAAPTGPQDMFKGMSPEQIEEFKATASPETHDMNLAPLLEAINGFNAEFKRLPVNQEEMVKKRYLARVLYAPKGKKYVIDPKTGEVTVE